MQEDNKVFHQAKAEMWERLEIIKSLEQIFKLGVDDKNPILDNQPTRLDLRIVINDLTNRALKELRNSNVYGS